MHRTRSIQSLAVVLGIQKSTMFRIKEEKVEKIFMPVSIAVKPLLTKVNKMHHVLFCHIKGKCN
jgi:hypothetical protein